MNLFKRIGILALAVVSTTTHALVPDEAKIREMLMSVANTGPDANDSYEGLKVPGDKAAYNFAQKTINESIEGAIKELGEMKLEAKRYLIIAKNNEGITKDKFAMITAAHQETVQSRYNQFIYNLKGNNESAALKKCISEACVIEVSNAFEELTQFAKKMDKGIDFKNMSNTTELMWKFKNPLNNNSVKQVFKNMIEDNKDHNGFKVLAAGAFAPLSWMGAAVGENVEALLDPRYRNINFSIKKSNIDFDQIEKRQQEDFYNNYTEAASLYRIRRNETLKKDCPEIIKQRYANFLYFYKLPENSKVSYKEFFKDRNRMSWSTSGENVAECLNLISSGEMTPPSWMTLTEAELELMPKTLGIAPNVNKAVNIDDSKRDIKQRTDSPASEKTDGKAVPK